MAVARKVMFSELKSWSLREKFFSFFCMSWFLFEFFKIRVESSARRCQRWI